MPAQRITAKDGDSIESLAFAHGHFWETLWNDPQNAALKALRQEPNILEEGDHVSIPPLRLKQVDNKPVDHRYRFRRKGVPSELHVRMLLNEDEPRFGLPYRITVKGRVVKEGTTDSGGWIHCFLMPDVTGGTLEFPETGESYEFTIGDVRPLASIRGLQARLHNLGLYDGPVDGNESPALEAAILAFQDRNKLPATGLPDAATIAALKERHCS